MPFFNGDENDNVLTGGAEQDILRGQAGADTLTVMRTTTS
jgi:hypothetical protein